MHDRYHGELANELGNLVSRSVAMVDALPRRRDPAGAVGARAGRRWRREVAARPTSTASSVLDFTGALERVWELVRALNRFVEERAPWELARSEEPGAAAALDETLATLCEGVRVLGGAAVAVPAGQGAR